MVAEEEEERDLEKKNPWIQDGSEADERQIWRGRRRSWGRAWERQIARQTIWCAGSFAGGICLVGVRTSSRGARGSAIRRRSRTQVWVERMIACFLGPNWGHVLELGWTFGPTFYLWSFSSK